MFSIKKTINLADSAIKKRFPKDHTKYYSALGIVSKQTNQHTFISTINRTAGKTSFHILNNLLMYENQKKQYVFILRNVSEMSEMHHQFNDIATIYGYSGTFKTIKIVKDTIYGIMYEEEIIAYIVSIKKPDPVKKYSGIFKNVTIMCMDEYQTIDGKYAKNESSNMDSLYRSIARGGGKQVREDLYLFLLGNPYTLMNPYLIATQIYKLYDKNKHYVWNEKTIAEFKIMEESSKELIESSFTGTFNDSSIDAFNAGIEFLVPANSNVRKIPRKTRYNFTLQIGQKLYGVRSDDNIIHISSSIDPNGKILCISDFGRSESAYFLSKNDLEYRYLKMAYKFNKLYFDKLETKHDIYRLLAIDIMPM